jgi:hypothetical protein
VDDTARELTVVRLRHGLHLATLLIAAVSLFGLALPLLLAGDTAYRSPAQQVVAFAALAATAVVTAAHLVRHKPFGRLRGVLLALVCTASALAVTGVHADHLLSESEWSYGVIGWFLLVLLLDRGAPVTCLALGAHVLASAGYTAWAGQDVTGLAVVTVLVLGYQLPVVAAAVVLDRLAEAATAAARRDEEIRTAEAIAERLHADRKARYDVLLPGVVPLLADLAAGAADLSDTRVRGRYAVEAARLRRRFAEHDDVPDPLAHELRACANLAERRGVAVRVDTGGERPALPPHARRHLVDAVTGLLVTARTTAKVTVSGGPEATTVSVVADGMAPGTAGDVPGIAVTTVVAADRVWVEATWRPT